MRLEARVVVITGASSGLGAGMAEWFAGQGADLGLCARRTPHAPNDRTVSRSVDVTDKAALEMFAADVNSSLGPIDLWINNAGVIEPVVAQRDLELVDFEANLAVNVGGVLNGTQAFLDTLRTTGHRGALVNISSGLARKGRAGLTAYCAAKAAVDRLTEVVAIEEAGLITRALAVAPGVVETGMQASLRTQDEDVLHDVDMFRGFESDGSMNSPAWVASHIARWAFGDADGQGVILRVPRENPS